MNKLNDIIDIKIINITPDIARQYLDKARQNRRLSSMSIDRYASDMMAGKWDVNSQGLSFDDEGYLLDGSHRCAAVIKSGMTVAMLVTTGWPKGSNKHIDQHYQRNSSATIKISYGDDCQWLAEKDNMSAVRAIIEIASQGKVKPSLEKIMHVADSIKSEVEFVTKLPHKHRRKVTIALTAGALTLYLAINGMTEKNKSKAERFMAILGGDATLDKSEISAHTLARFLELGGITSNSGNDRILHWQVVYYFFKKFVNGEIISKVLIEAVKKNQPEIPSSLKLMITS